jgi:hypothetical protein
MGMPVMTVRTVIITESSCAITSPLVAPQHTVAMAHSIAWHVEQWAATQLVQPSCPSWGSNCLQPHTNTRDMPLTERGSLKLLCCWAR